MTPRERIVNQILGREVDRVPTIGGWMHGPRNLARLAGLSLDEYLRDPLGNLVRAHRALGVDGMIMWPVTPDHDGQIRTSAVLEEGHRDKTPDDLRRRGDAVPDSDAGILAEFDPAAQDAWHREWIGKYAAAYGDIVLIPTFWNSVASFMLYQEYGYPAYLEACALYPDAIEAIYRQTGVLARAANEVLAGLYDELDLVPMLFTGHDVCMQTGPIASPEFLRERYWPHVRHAIEPLVDAGIRVVHHCDGNIMPVVDDIIPAGFEGFQGFQYECGVDGFEIAKRASAAGERLLFMAGLNVTRTLPYGTTDDVRDEIEYVLDYTDGGKGLLFFTSSSVGPEVPLENVTSGYDYIRRCDVHAPRPNAGIPRPWPGTSRFH